MMRHLCGLIAVLLAVATAADDTPPRLPRLPWHLVNIWWTFEKEEPDFQSLELDVAINQDVDSSKLNLYISPIGSGRFNDVHFYGGLQSNSNGFAPESPTQRERVHIGKGAIFSRWGEKGLSLDNVRPATDGLVESAGYEGDFCSVRRPYRWTAGRYTYELCKLDFEKKDDAEYSWVGAFVTNHQTKERTFIGALRFPGRTLKFWNRNSAFVEIYGTSRLGQPAIADLPPLEVRFGQIRVNGQTVKPTRLHVHYPTEKDGPKVPAAPPLMTTELSADGTEIICRLHNQLLDRKATDLDLKLPAR